MTYFYQIWKSYLVVTVEVQRTVLYVCKELVMGLGLLFTGRCKINVTPPQTLPSWNFFGGHLTAANYATAKATLLTKSQAKGKDGYRSTELYLWKPN